MRKTYGTKKPKSLDDYDGTEQDDQTAAQREFMTQLMEDKNMSGEHKVGTRHRATLKEVRQEQPLNEEETK